MSLADVPHVYRKGRKYQYGRRSSANEVDKQTYRLWVLETRHRMGLLGSKKEVRELERLQELARAANWRLHDLH